ncbi:MAG: hypothetical protein FWH43_08345 [Endomicrobia bacterium]|nr:hypothetical protein [Endomicrobiia bacterium]
MKRIICLALAMLLYSNAAFGYGGVNYDDFSEYKSKYRILYGAILAAGGIALAYDGFRTVKVNKSKPAVGLNFSSYWYNDGNYKYVINTEGNIINAGNVDLRNIKVWVRYKTKEIGTGELSNQYRISEFGTQIKFEGNASIGPLGNLVIGETVKWDGGTIQYPTVEGGLTNPPMGTETTSLTDPNYVDFNYSYPNSVPSELVDIVKIEYDYTKKYKEEMNNQYEGLLGVLLIAGGAYLLIDYFVSLRRFDYYMKKNNMDVFVANSGEEFKLMLSKKL